MNNRLEKTMAINQVLIRKKAEQNLSNIPVHPLDALMECPINRSIITVEQWVGSRCLSIFREKWNKEKEQLKSCDKKFITYCITEKKFADF